MSSLGSKMKECANDILDDLRKIPNDLADEIESLNAKINNQFEFVKEGIKLRIESLRVKLDEIEASFEKKLEESKKKIKDSISGLLNIDELREEIIKLELNLKINETKIEKIQNMNQLSTKFNQELESIRQFKFTLSFTEDENFDELFNEDAIGKFHACLFDLCECMVPHQLMEKLEFQTIQINYKPIDILQLPDKRYLARKRGPNNLQILDSNLQFIKAFKSPNVFQDYTTEAMACDSEHIYLAFKSRLIKYNHNFKIVAETRCFDLSYLLVHKDRLYACRGTCIFVFTKDLEKIETHQLFDCEEVSKIRILNDVACVYCLAFNDYFRFYRLSNFKSAIARYPFGSHSFAVYKNFFCAYSDNKFYCFDSNGKLLSLMAYNVGSARDMLVTDDKIIMCLLCPYSGYAISKIY